MTRQHTSPAPAQELDEDIEWFAHAEELVRQSVELTKDEKAAFERVLAFAQRAHPGTMNDLAKHVIKGALRRPLNDFPVPGPSERLTFSLPDSLHEKLDAIVLERQQTEPRAELKHLLAHIFSSWLTGQTKLAKAWRVFEEAEQEIASCDGIKSAILGGEGLDSGVKSDNQKMTSPVGEQERADAMVAAEPVVTSVRHNELVEQARQRARASRGDVSESN